MRKLESVPQICGLGMKGRSISLKGMLLVGVHRAYGCPSDTLIHGYHQFSYFFLRMYKTLKRSDEQAGNCASNLKNGDEV